MKFKCILRVSTAIWLLLEICIFSAHATNMPFLASKGIVSDGTIKYSSFFTHTRVHICNGAVIYQHLQKDSSVITVPAYKTPFNRNFYAYNVTNIRAEFLGYNTNSEISGREPTSAMANFFIGNDSSKWVTNVPYYNSILQRDLYQGVDVRYFINNNDVEYNFELKPYADLSQIRIQFKGTEHLSQIDNKTIQLQANGKTFTYIVPEAYQKNGNKKKSVEIYIIVLNDSTISFTGANYNRALALVVDPVLKFSTYIGGTGDDYYYGTQLIVDDKHNIYNAGVTASSSFPTTTGAYSTKYGGGIDDAVVMKFSGTGVLMFSTFLGGKDFDYAYCVAVYPKTYDIAVTGGTWSSNFPSTPGAYQTTNSSTGSNGDIYIAKFNSTGSKLKLSTFAGGTGDDQGQTILLDSAYNFILTGQGQTIPTTTGVYQTSTGGDYDSYILKMDSNATHLLGGTFVGGSDRDRTQGLAIGNNGYYVIGSTTGSHFPVTSGAYNKIFKGGATDIVIYKISKDLKSLIYSTYIGGTGTDAAAHPILDSSGNVTFAATASSGYPTTSGAYDTSFAGGGTDAAVTKINSTGSGLIFSTFIGSSGADNGISLTLDNCNDILVTGSCAKGFPVTKNAYDTSYSGGNSDAFISKFNSNCSKLLYSTFIGGSGVDIAKNIRYDSGFVVLVGQTSSTDYPTTSGAYQSSDSGGLDFFFTKLSIAQDVPTVTDTSFCKGKSIIIGVGNSANTYLWSTGDTTHTISINKIGKYWVRLKTKRNCDNISDTFNITLRPNPTVKLSRDSTICSCNSITLNAYNAGATYMWSTGDTTAKVIAVDSGTYSVKIDLNGCMAYDTINITQKGKTPTWSKVGNMPISGRRYSVVLTYNNKAYIFGGILANGTYTDSLWEYDPSVNIWTAMKPYPGGARYAASGFVIGHKGYICFGQDGFFSLHNDLYSFDFITKTWTKLSSYTTSLYACASFAIGNYGYIATGSTGGPPYINKACRYNTITDKWDTITSVPPYGVEAASGLAINGYGYVFGGYHNPGGRREILKYDTATKKWTQINQLPDSAYAMQIAFSVCNKLYLVTGIVFDTTASYASAGNAVFSYNHIKNTVSRLSPFPGPKRDQALGFGANGSGYVLSGYNGSTYFTDIWKLSVSSSGLPDTIFKFDTSFCTGNAITLKANRNNLKYIWNTGDSVQTISVKDSGKYFVHFRNTVTCTNILDSFNITIKPLPTKSLYDTSLCAGQPLRLDAKNTGSTYLWSTSATSEKISVTSTGEYKVKITLSGCSITDSAHVTIKPYPAVHLGNDTTFCSGNILILNGGNTGAKYVWSTGDTTQTITVGKSNTYSVIVNLNGCLGYDTLNLIVKPPLPYLRDTTLCVGPSITLDAGNSGATYQWNTTETTETISVKSTGLYKVKINVGTCTITDSAKVVFNPYPKVHLGNDTTVCAGTLLILNASNAGAVYNWNTGDTSGKLNITKTNTYIVSVNLKGCISSDTINIFVNPVPKPYLHDSALCIGQPLVLNAGNKGAVYKWNTSDTSQSISPTYPGTYKVLITLHGCSITDSAKIIFNPYPVKLFVKDTAVCAGQLLSLDAGNTGAKYYWSNADTTQSITVNNSGTYQVKVDLKGCIIFDTINVMIKSNPVKILRDTSLCEGMPLILNAGNKGATYLWNTTAKTQKISVTGTGIYVVSITLNGCSVSDSSEVVFKPNPSADTVQYDTICNNAKISLDAGNKGDRFKWNTGDTTQKIDITGKTGNYTYWVNINAAGCMGSDTFRVATLPFPLETKDSLLSICSGDSALLNAGNPGYTYLWSTGQKSETIKVVAPGMYWVKISDYKCSIYDTINVQSVSKPVVSLGGDKTLCYIGVSSVELNAHFSPAQYHWNTGDTTQIITVHDTGAFWVKVKNECGVTGDIVHINLDNNCCVLDIPNAFTPGNENINNKYRVLTDCILDEFLFRIYNRWGQLVFETRNVKEAWDGNFNGKASPQDVYMWYMTYKKTGAELKHVQGDVTLIR